MADARRFQELGMVGRLAAEVKSQIETSIATKTAVAALAAIGTADATDLASAIALANATKARVNQVIAALKA